MCVEQRSSKDGSRYCEVVQCHQGVGFIAPDGGGEDLFVHQSEIQAQGYRELLEGQRVEFEVTQGKKGMQASSVHAI